MGTLRIMDATGDTVIEWEPGEVESVARAEDAFRHQLHRRHRIPFARRAGEAANRARPITEFDPTAEEILFASAVVGG